VGNTNTVPRALDARASRLSGCDTCVRIFVHDLCLKEKGWYCEFRVHSGPTLSRGCLYTPEWGPGVGLVWGKSGGPKPEGPRSPFPAVSRLNAGWGGAHCLPRVQSTCMGVTVSTYCQLCQLLSVTVCSCELGIVNELLPRPTFHVDSATPP
jgi:hypothetical protein